MAGKQKKKQLSPKQEGIEAGLKIGLFFAVAFYWLGYNGFISIFLAAFGGVSAGCIVAWSKITDEPEHELPYVNKKTLASHTKTFNAYRQKVGLGKKK